jgi:hypothetical protein
MIPVDNLLWRNTLITGFQGNWYAMFVGTAYRNDIFALQPEIPCVNIGRYINSGQVTDVDRSVGIGESGGDQVSFKLLHETENEL